MFKKIRIDFEPNIIEGNNYSLVNPISTSLTDLKNAEVSSLLVNGWKLHSVIPIQGIYNSTNIQSNITTGVEFIFINDKVQIDAILNVNNSLIDESSNDIGRNTNFIMPDINLTIEQKKQFYTYWISKWNWDGDDGNLNLTGRALGARTNLINRGILSNDPNSDRFFLPTFIERRAYVNRRISDAYNQISNETYDENQLFDAFNSIQAWGGIEGRRFYDINEYGIIGSVIQGYDLIKEHWVKHWFPYYKSFVSDIYNGNSNPRMILQNLEPIRGLGLSFGSKHLYFWSKIAKENSRQKEIYPIYDTLLKKIFTLGMNPPAWTEYNIYYKSLLNRVNELDNQFSLVDIERSYFAYYEYVGIGLNNQVPIEHENEPTILVNDFLNSRFI